MCATSVSRQVFHGLMTDASFPGKTVIPPDSAPGRWRAPGAGRGPEHLYAMVGNTGYPDRTAQGPRFSVHLSKTAPGRQRQCHDGARVVGRGRVVGARQTERCARQQPDQWQWALLCSTLGSTPTKLFASPPAHQPAHSIPHPPSRAQYVVWAPAPSPVPTACRQQAWAWWH